MISVRVGCLMNCISSSFRNGFLKFSTLPLTETSDSAILEENTQNTGHAESRSGENNSNTASLPAYYKNEVNINGIVKDMQFLEEDGFVQSTRFVLYHHDSSGERKTFLVRSFHPSFIMHLYNKKIQDTHVTLKGALYGLQNGTLLINAYYVKVDKP